MKKILTCFMWGVLMGLVVHNAAGSMFQKSQKQLYAETASQTVMMLNPENDKSGGTGFAVRAASGRIYTMTNAHVCGISKTGYMVAKQGNLRIRLQILDISDKTDLCILSPLPGFPGLDLAHSVNLRDAVYVTGHPRLRPVTMTAGWIIAREIVPVSYCEAFKQGFSWVNIRGPLEDLFDQLPDCVKQVDSFTTNAASEPGNSGSSAVNDDGKVVGVLYAGGGGVSELVPLNYVQDFLAAY